MGDDAGADEVAELKKHIDRISADHAEVIADMKKESENRLNAVKKSNDEAYRALELKLKELLAQAKKEAKAALDKLQSEKDEMQEKMQTDFDAMKARLENDNKELTIAKDNIIDTLRKDLKASEELAEKRQAELVEVGQKMALAAREGPKLMVAASKSLTEKQNSIDVLKSKLEALQAEAKDYKVFFDMKDDVRLELNETQSKNSSLSAQIEELTTERDSLKQTKASLEKDVKEARFDRKEAINSEDELSTKYDEETEAYTKDVQLKAARIEELEEQVAGLEAELKANEELSAKNQEEFATNISAVRAELGESLAAETSKATAAQAEIAKFRTEDEAIHARLEKEIAAVKSDIKNEKTARKEVDDELAQNVRALAETKVEVEKKVEMITELRGKNEALVVEKDEALSDKKKNQQDSQKSEHRITGELNIVKLEVETMKKTVERRDRELKSAQAATAQIRDQLNDKGKTYDELKVSYDHTIAERDALTTQVEEITKDFKIEMDNLTKTYQENRTQMEERQQATVDSLEATVKSNEEDSQKQLQIMTEARGLIEARNTALQHELMDLETKSGKQSETILKMTADLSAAMRNLEQNEKAFRQLASDIEAAGKLNESLKADIVKLKEDWDADNGKNTEIREELTTRIEALNQDLANEQGKLSDTRKEVVEQTALLEKSDADSLVKQGRIEELEQTVEQMEEAAVDAEQLRDEIRTEHKKDVEDGGKERAELSANVKKLAEDLEDVQTKLDELRAEALEAKKNFSEEKIKRESREMEIEKGARREKKLQEAIEEKDVALEGAKDAAVNTADQHKAEMKESQQKRVDLEEKLKLLDVRAEEYMMEISGQKIRNQESTANGAEGWARAESEEQRAKDAEADRSSVETDLTETQEGWKEDIAAKEAEKLAIVEKDAALMKDMEEQRTKAEEESNMKMQEENLRKQAQAELAQTKVELDDAVSTREDQESRFTALSSKVAEMSAETAQQHQLDLDERKVLEVQVQKMKEDADAQWEKCKDLEGSATTALAAKGDAEGAQASEAEERQNAEAERDAALAIRDEREQELADTISTTNDAKAQDDGTITELKDTIDDLSTAKLSLETDNEDLNTKYDASKDAQAALEAENESLGADKENLEHWKEDTTAELHAVETHLEEVQGEFEKKTNDTEAASNDAQNKADAAERDLEQQVQAKQRADQALKESQLKQKEVAEAMAIEKANNETQQAKIKQLSKELEGATAGWTKASGDKTEERTSSNALGDELALTKSQLAAALRKQEEAETARTTADQKVAGFERTEVDRAGLMNGLVKAYHTMNKGRKEQAETLTKLLAQLKRAEAQVKASEAAFKGDQPNAMIRKDTDEVAEMIKAMAGGWDDKAGQWQTDDVVAASAKHVNDSDEFSKEAAAMEEDVKKRLMQGAVDPVAQAMAKGGGGGGAEEKSFEFLEAALEVDKTGKGNSFKKRYFKLGKNTLTYASSSKADAKVLGIIQLSGGKFELKGAAFAVKEEMSSAAGNSYLIKCKSPTEAKKWVAAIEQNVANSA